MKNIHVLPTDKPSNGYILGKCIKELPDVKIGQFTKTYYLMFDEEYFQPHNIYITSDEEIKIRDWVYCKDDNTVIQLGTNLSVMLANQQKEKYGFKTFYKIILTTDQDLIKDGVQSIDDEFLEWFVKNPSCEEVEVEKGCVLYDFKYKIIIPKEEPKQETLEEFINSQPYYGSCTTEYLEGIEIGAEWQQEQDKNKYSEEDLKEAFLDGWQLRDGDLPFPKAKKKWFEQLKKKLDVHSYCLMIWLMLEVGYMLDLVLL